MNRRRFLSSCATVCASSLIAPPFLRRALASPQSSAKSYALIGDGGWHSEDDKGLRASLHRSQIADVLLLGDNLYDYDSTLEATWDVWKNEGFHFPIVTIGNHTPGAEIEAAYFGVPGEYYAYRDGASLFLNLNSNNVKSAKEQSDWLRAQLEAADAQFIFVIFHHPSFDLGIYHHWQQRGAFHIAVRPALRDQAGKITAIFNAHEHIAGLYDLNGIPLVVSGAVRDTFQAYPRTQSLDGIDLKTLWIYDGNPTWARLDIDADKNSALLSFIEVDSERTACAVELARHPAQPSTNPIQLPSTDPKPSDLTA